jgi:hypothetical protein
MRKLEQGIRAETPPAPDFLGWTEHTQIGGRLLG